MKTTMPAMNTITTTARESVRARTACAMFSLRIEHAQSRSLTSLRPQAIAAREIDRMLGPSHIAFITGPSGSGKSTILRALKHRLIRRTHHVICADPNRLTDSRRPIVDLFDIPLPRTLRQLARVGLADATVFPLAAAELSDGQRLRLSIALALAAASKTDAPTTILADEFASVLDSATANALALGIARWIRSSRHIRIVAATARDEVLEALDPDLLVYQPLLGPPRVHRRGGVL